MKPTKQIIEPKLNKLHVRKQKTRGTLYMVHLYDAFLDASKAFDVVWHEGMFHKLNELGVTDDLWLLYRNLYSNMSSTVK